MKHHCCLPPSVSYRYHLSFSAALNLPLPPPVCPMSSGLKCMAMPETIVLFQSQVHFSFNSLSAFQLFAAADALLLLNQAAKSSYDLRFWGLTTAISGFFFRRSRPMVFDLSLSTCAVISASSIFLNSSSGAGAANTPSFKLPAFSQSVSYLPLSSCAAFFAVDGKRDW